MSSSNSRKKVALIMPVEKVFLSTSELRKYLDCSDDFIEDLRNQAQLEFFRIGKKIWYLKKDVDNLIIKNRVI